MSNAMQAFRNQHLTKPYVQLACEWLLGITVILQFQGIDRLNIYITLLTWVRNFKPRSYSQHSLPCISAGIKPVLGVIWWENICHGEDEAQQPGNKDCHDNLKKQYM